MKPIATTPGDYSKSRLLVPRVRIPKGLELKEELGKGSNNKVFRSTLNGTDYAFRVPRRKSDTQQRGSAVWEFRHTLKASQLGVGPLVYDWRAARGTRRRSSLRTRACACASGLYVLTELLRTTTWTASSARCVCVCATFFFFVSSLFPRPRRAPPLGGRTNEAKLAEHRDMAAQAVVDCLQKLADELRDATRRWCIFVYDLEADAVQRHGQV